MSKAICTHIILYLDLLQLIPQGDSICTHDRTAAINQVVA